MRVVSPPFKPNSLLGLARILCTPIFVLKDFIQIMKFDLVRITYQFNARCWISFDKFNSFRFFIIFFFPDAKLGSASKFQVERSAMSQSSSFLSISNCSYWTSRRFAFPKQDFMLCESLHSIPIYFFIFFLCLPI